MRLGALVRRVPAPAGTYIPAPRIESTFEASELCDVEGVASSLLETGRTNAPEKTRTSAPSRCNAVSSTTPRRQFSPQANLGMLLMISQCMSIHVSTSMGAPYFRCFTALGRRHTLNVRWQLLMRSGFNLYGIRWDSNPRRLKSKVWFCSSTHTHG